MIIEYFHPNGKPLRLIELGPEFIRTANLPLANAERPFRVEAEPKTSKAGNTYFEYQHASVPLPDGLNTVLRVEGKNVEMEEEHLSDNGNPTRNGKAIVSMDSVDYEVSVNLTKGRRPYWIKVHAHKAPQRPRQTTGPLAGGRIV